MGQLSGMSLGILLVTAPPNEATSDECRVHEPHDGDGPNPSFGCNEGGYEQNKADDGELGRVQHLWHRRIITDLWRAGPGSRCTAQSVTVVPLIADGGTLWVRRDPPSLRRSQAEDARCPCHATSVANETH
jgi:hypothetical protein